MRLIDADALMQTLGITDMDCGRCDLHGAMGCSKKGDFVDACVAIEHAPTVEGRKMKGKWRNIQIGKWLGVECTACKIAHDRREVPHGNGGEVAWKFCPYCEADMKGENDGE